MSNGKRMSWIYGFRSALEVMRLLVDVTDRLAIGGSLRRGEAWVGDIELVMRPKFLGERNLLEERCEALLTAGTLDKRFKSNGSLMAWNAKPIPGDPDGRSGARYKAAEYKGIPLDLFIVLPDHQWGPTMVLRTGPGDANQVLVTPLGVPNRNGDKGVLPKGVRFEGGAITRDGVKLDTPEEWDVFAALGMPWISPDKRTVGEYQRRAGRIGWDAPGREDVPVDCFHLNGVAYEIYEWEIEPRAEPVSAQSVAVEQMPLLV